MERWRRTLYVVWVSQIVCLMSYNFHSPFLPFYLQEMGITEPDKIKMYIGIINAAPPLALVISCPIWGYLSDKFGKRNILLKSILTGSLVLAGMGFASSVEVFIICCVCQGLFTAIVSAGTALIASSSPNERMSYSLGFLSSSSFIGLSIGPLLGGFLSEYIGYRTCFFIGAALLMIDFFVILFTVKEDRVVPVSDKSPIIIEIPKVKIPIKVVIIVFLCLFLSRIARMIFTPYIPLYAQEMLQDTIMATRMSGVINSVVSFMAAFAGITLTRLGDKVNKRIMLLILFVLSIVLSLPVMMLDRLVLFTIVYGLMHYFLGGIEPLLMAVICEYTPQERRGLVFGIQGMVGSLGWGVAPLCASYISINFSIQSILYINPVVLILAVICILILIINRKQNIKSCKNTGGNCCK